MHSLPLEIRKEILRHLNVNDLARCGRVSRGVREGADEVLTSIRCIYHKEELSDDPWDSHYTFLWLNSTFKETMVQAEFSLENISSFLQFITEKCPRITSLIARNHSVYLNDIAALAPRLTYFSLDEIKKQSGKEESIDAKTMVAHFTNLQCYHVCTGRCSHDVARKYSLLPTSQFAQYDECCPQHILCYKMVKHRAMKSLRMIVADMSLSLNELHPSSFNSLQVLSVEGSIFAPDNSPHFPNLLVAVILSENNLNSMIRLLSFSSRLLAVRLTGVLDQETPSAIDLLLSACSALQVFHYDPSRDSDVGNAPLYSLDFIQLKSIRSFTWDHFNIPLKLTFPPHCHQIVCDWRSVCFNIERRTYAFHPSSIFVNSMSTFNHPIEVVISHGIYARLFVPPLIRFCPQLSLTLSFGSEYHCRGLINLVLPLAMGATNVREITLASRDKKKRIFKSNLETLFMLIGGYTDQSYSIKLRGEISYNLQSIIKAQINREFTIRRDNSKSPPETFVNIPSSSNVSPPANTQ